MYDDEDNDDGRDEHYKRELRDLQIELVKLQRHLLNDDCARPRSSSKAATARARMARSSA